jgi:hypothetical protein
MLKSTLELLPGWGETLAGKISNLHYGALEFQRFKDLRVTLGIFSLMGKIDLFKSGRGWHKLLLGLVVGALLSSGAAYSLSVNNTSEGGYLLCYNVKTTAVTFPGKLSCPTGTKPLEVAGVYSTPVPGSPRSTRSATPKPSALSTKCTLAYLRSAGANIAGGIESCAGSQFTALLQELETSSSSSTSEIDKRILTELTNAIQKKLKP